jgi:molybdenum cofactor cytidylyltransferase
MNYAAIILAAGLSSRLGQFKPLLSIGGETLADRIISTFLHNEVEVILVTGYRQDELKAGLKTADITIVENPDYQKGMFTSVQSGAGCLKPTHKGFFVMPVDIPLVRPATIRRLLDEAAKTPDSILYPVFNGLRGHPPLIPSALVPAVRQWQKEGGLKALLASHEENAREVAVPDSYILLDVDTPENLKDLSDRFRRYGLPTPEEQKVILNSLTDIDPARRRHCLKVAEVAGAVGRALQASGHSLDLEMVLAAAALHDIAKGQSKHDLAGGEMLRRMGFAAVGDIVAVHSDLSGGDTGLSLEAKIVFLADKLVQGEKMVSIDERYRTTSRQFAVTPEIESRISGRKQVALKVKGELETLLGYPLERIIF